MKLIFNVFPTQDSFGKKISYRVERVSKKVKKKKKKKK